ncbi:PAS domain-containing sensor histidine kinase [Methylobacterium sp. Leaf123]|uniref:PAS domain-containing sensor histidine kinase n=1 Tax=Methylobacterium sp. Leaf123 TaxID=1736264 RepID=UPI0007007742|nr:PAS domain-containing sensor histidine kinase [Methylobacterium sp. Leaf123]KQQ31433.1 PAS domain-containing sensor histidine kinase [Methylobacterium sp. Leaf123]
MSDRAVQASYPGDDAAVRAALARWRDDASIAHLVREGSALLVLDEAAERILYAAGAALPLRAGVAASDGAILPALRLSEQIRRAGALGARPRMIRLRFDPRGVAPPVVALAARVELGEGHPVLLLAPIGALPALRPFDNGPAKADPPPEAAIPAVAQPEAPPPSPAPEVETEPAELPIRVIWRSDAAGVLTLVSRTHPDLAEALSGRFWDMLATDGVIEGAALTEALAGRRTFRALPLLVRGRAYEHTLEISGAPAGRATADFSGFGGFAILGERHARVMESAVEDEDDEPEAPQEEPPVDEAEAEAGLSVNEHAAFREVARVLGLRFAPDEDADDAAPMPARPESAPSGSVMPFPVPQGRLSEGETRSRFALTELLESLPLGVLVYRGSEMLFASRTFLDLTGYADLPALRQAGLAHLFRGLPPRDREIIGPVPFARPEGGTVALLVDRAGLVWEGVPAEICLARAMPTAGDVQLPAVPANAARLRAEKVLDSLEEGVVTLDAEGRVVGLNPSAAELVHAHPKEIVGGRFADLFAPESLSALETAVTDSRRSGTSEIHGVTVRTGAAALRLRIARLLGEDAPGYCASLREIRDEDATPPAPVAEAVRRSEPEVEGAWKANALARVSREIRPSLNAILGLTDMMLSDRFDRADAERLEAYLREVRLSGGRIASLIDDLRDLAEIQAGRGKLTFADLALNDLVASCIAVQQPQAARDRIVLRTSLAPNLPAMKADERSIRQAALTVLGNAIRVTEAGGQVIVSTTLAERGEVALRVRDTGTGMTEDELMSALEPFGADLGPAPEGDEKGFGLTLTKALVEANRGRFRISSRKDEGTLVEMLFPAA